MSRRELREQIFKMLFRIEFHEGMEMEEQMQLFLEEEEEISSDLGDSFCIYVIKGNP